MLRAPSVLGRHLPPTDMHQHVTHAAWLRRALPSFPVGLAIVLLLATAETASAQPEYLDTAGRWKTLNAESWSGFGNDLLRPTGLFFRDRETGWMSVNTWWTRTTDGGRTWTPDVPAVPVPHRVDASGFGVAPDGLVSLDSGATWTTVGHRGTTVDLVAWDRTRLLRQYRDTRNPMRLAVSTDAGTTWRELDELDTAGGTARLRQRTALGDLPTSATPGASAYWVHISAMESPTRFSAIVGVFLPTGVVERWHYAGLDLERNTASWTSIPPHRSPRIAGPDELWDFAMKADGSTGMSYPTHLVTSTDGGRTWDSAEVPRWIESTQLSAFGNGTYMSPQGRTTDFGRTWTPITHHYYPRAEGAWVTTTMDRSAMREAVVDTGCVVVASRYSAFARTTDLGRTWQQNVSGNGARAVAACRGRVIVGRDGRSALFSPDSGETWIELGSIGALPEHLSTIWAIGYPDSVADPLRALAVAGFHLPGRRYEVRVIESRDGGRTWDEGTRIAALEKGLGPFEPLALMPVMELDQNLDFAVRYSAISFEFAPHPQGGPNHGFIATQRSLVRSTDAGRTWTEVCDTITFARLKMASAMTGIAASVGTIRRPSAIYSTSDGGTSWTWRRTLYSPGHYVLDIGWLGGGNYQVLTPNMNQMESLYSYRTSDSGVTWRQNLLLKSGISAQGWLLWLDTADIHSIRPGANILHSTNGGESFQLLHPTLKVFDAPRVGFDGSYLYIVSPGNNLGRWRIARRTRIVASIETPETAAVAGFYPNPARMRTTLRTGGTGASTVEVTVVDILGRIVLRRFVDAQPDGIPIDVSELPPGAYRARIVLGSQVLHSGFIVEGR